MPAVTVVITTYNLERYIARCLDDLLGQTMADFDILVVDDHSTDTTAYIVQSYTEQYPGRIRFLLLPGNLGSSSRTRNAALDSGMIEGDYVVFLDGDDRVEKDYLKSLYTAAKAFDADMAVCSFDRINEADGRMICSELQWLPDGGTLESKDPSLAFFNGAVWNKLIRHAAIGAERIPDLKIGEDVSFALKLYARCNRIACIRRNLIHYQVRTGSAMAGTDKDSIFRFADELARQYRDADEKNRLVLALAAYLHIVLSMMMRAAEHREINLAAHYQWTRDYCKNAFHGFADIEPTMFLKYPRRMLKGAAICLSFYCYRHGWLFLPAVRLLRLYTRVTGRDIKW